MYIHEISEYVDFQNMHTYSKYFITNKVLNIIIIFVSNADKAFCLQLPNIDGMLIEYWYLGSLIKSNCIKNYYQGMLHRFWNGNFFVKYILPAW